MNSNRYAWRERASPGRVLIAKLLKGKGSGACKGTILELFSAISWQVCHRLSSLVE